MSIHRHVLLYSQRKMTGKLMRTMPWLGGILALLTIGAAVRQKGFVRGVLDIALDMTPFVGGAKNFAEAVRGRDFLRDARRGGSASTPTQFSVEPEPVQGGVRAR